MHSRALSASPRSTCAAIALRRTRRRLKLIPAPASTAARLVTSRRSATMPLRRTPVPDLLAKHETASLVRLASHVRLVLLVRTSQRRASIAVARTTCPATAPSPRTPITLALLATPPPRVSRMATPPLADLEEALSATTAARLDTFQRSAPTPTKARCATSARSLDISPTNALSPRLPRPSKPDLLLGRVNGERRCGDGVKERRRF
jgi:hypothetical protein